MRSSVEKEPTMHILDDFATLNSLEPYVHRTKQRDWLAEGAIEDWINESLKRYARLN